MRLTKICATIGPSTQTSTRLEGLVAAGMDIARLNFSHGDLEFHRRVAGRVRRAARRASRPVALLQDLQGPRIRIGRLPDGGLDLAVGDLLLLSSGRARSGRLPTGTRSVPLTHPRLCQEARRGDRILLRDGTIRLRVRSVRTAGLLTEVEQAARLTTGAGLNAPDSPLDVPALTRRDREHLRAGLEMGIDAVALSFVRDGDDIGRARELIRRAGREALIVAKIERKEAVDNLDGILEQADGVIVARGDLGVECSLEAVPMLQKQIIRQAIRSGCFVITATQMLESMTEHPTPTRAEVSDVANAVLDGSDAVMLSGETAVGLYPVQAVATMDRICRQVEAAGRTHVAEQAPCAASGDFLSALARAAVELAGYSSSAALAAFTQQGKMARLLSFQRPGLPIHAFVASDPVGRRLTFHRGVRAVKIPQAGSWDKLFERGLRSLVENGEVVAGEVVVLVGGHSISRGASNTLKVCRVPRGGVRE